MNQQLFRVVVVILFFIPALALGEVAVRPDHPQSYTVVRGDTLWDIAGRFLRNPWQWPEIWSKNPNIKNPHLIYPGDVLELVYVNGKPRIVRRSSSTRASATSSNVVRLSPRIRTGDGAIPPVSLRAMEPFLTHPRVMNEKALDESPHVIGFPDGNIIGGEGMNAYVHGMEDQTQSHYDIMRPGRSYLDLISGDTLGYLARHVGTATLVRGGNPATIRLDETEIEVIRGDRLVELRKPQLPFDFFPRPPQQRVDGNVLDAYETISQSGQGQVILVSLGARDGLTAGDVLLVDNSGRTIRDRFGPKEEQRVYDEVGGAFRQSIIPPEIRLPDERAGTIIVFDVFDRMSLALITESRRPIRTGDRVYNP